jgi:crotonobetainyl-CoA:carnitine CoA-transferase CaiB-like acyl-CoA transferase
MSEASEIPHAPPLAGVRVLDLSRVLAGPWCTMTLGDLGAEVIKIEHPTRGDDTRQWGPPWVDGESAYYLCTNRNKKSVAVDIATPQGQAVIRDLVLGCDVFVENFKAGDLDRYGLGYEAIAALNPRIVYCSISGYGRASPLAARAGYDYVIQAEGGLMAVTGEADGEPIKVGVAVADLFTGMAAAQAILAGVIAQRRDGLGQHIDMALFDCQLAMLANVGAAYLASGVEPKRYGNGHPSIVPYQTFHTADGVIVVAVGNDRQFTLFCRDALGRGELAEDSRFKTNADRLANREALVPILSDALRGESSAHWLERLNALGVPCGQVRSVGEALGSPEAVARGMVRTVAHPTAGDIRIVGSPLKFSRTPVVDPAPPPLLGEHTAEILERNGAPPSSSGGIS